MKSFGQVRQPFRRKMIKSADVSKISVTEEGVFVERKTLTAGIPAETRFLHTASAAFLPQAKPQSIKNMLPIEWQISAASIMEGIAWIAEAPLFKATGAMHVAALISQEKNFSAPKTSAATTRWTKPLAGWCKTALNRKKPH